MWTPSPGHDRPSPSPTGAALPLDPATTGVVIVDHGSRRAESNDMLLEVVRRYAQESHFPIVEPAHMELAEPSIDTAFDRCVARGAKRVVVMPYFLLPGKHWDQDIPDLSAAAARRHPGLAFMVTAPLGLHPLMNQLIEARIDYCLSHVAGDEPECEVCQGMDRCTLRAPAAAGDRPAVGHPASNHRP